MPTVKCPKCGRQTDVPAGETVVCSGCNSKLRLRDPSPREPQTAPRAPDAPVAEWYYAGANNERVGPLPTGKMVELIRSGELGGDSLVWKEGMSDWAKLGRTELAHLLREGPEPRRGEQRSAQHWAPDEGTLPEPPPRAPREMEAIPLGRSRMGSRIPLGIVWVAAHSALFGLVYLGFGIAILVGAGLLSGLSELGEQFGARSRGSGGEMIAVMLFELLAIVLLHLAILHLVCACGLLMRQRWGLSLARVLYVLGGVLAVIALIISIATRSGILSSLIGLLTQAVVLIYLFGGAGAIHSFHERFRAMSAGRGPDEDSWR